MGVEEQEEEMVEEGSVLDTEEYFDDQKGKGDSEKVLNAGIPIFEGIKVFDEKSECKQEQGNVMVLVENSDNDQDEESEEGEYQELEEKANGKILYDIVCYGEKTENSDEVIYKNEGSISDQKLEKCVEVDSLFESHKVLDDKRHSKLEREFVSSENFSKTDSIRQLKETKVKAIDGNGTGELVEVVVEEALICEDLEILAGKSERKQEQLEGPAFDILTLFVEKSENEPRQSFICSREIFDGSSTGEFKQVEVLSPLHISDHNFLKNGAKIDNLGFDFSSIEFKIDMDVFGFSSQYEGNCIPYMFSKYKRQLEYTNGSRNTIRKEIMHCLNELHYVMIRILIDRGKISNAGCENLDFATYLSFIKDFEIMCSKAGCKSLAFKFKDKSKHSTGSELVDLLDRLSDTHPVEVKKKYYATRLSMMSKHGNKSFSTRWFYFSLSVNENEGVGAILKSLHLHKIGRTGRTSRIVQSVSFRFCFDPGGLNVPTE